METYRYVYAVAYINKTFLSTISRDLERFGDGMIRSYIPTVKVMRKQFKNKKHYEDVPLLFNYGFFRIPFHEACNRDFLMRMKVAVQGIYNWLYVGEEPEKDEVTGKYFNTLLVATVKLKEIMLLKRACLLNSIYSSEDITAIGPEDFIILKGYPFDNIPAKVVSVNAKKEQVKVRLMLDDSNMFNEVTVDFSNVFYSIYSNFEDPTISDSTIEGLAARSKSGADKFMGDISELPEDY